MALFEWDEKYSVGVDLFDKQHKKLFDIINDLHEGMKNRQGKEVLTEILDEMYEYTQTHFEDEEEIMDEYGYPKSSAQKKKHDAYVEKIDEFRSQVENGKLLVSRKVYNYLQDWLKEHIMGMDMQYKEFFEDKDIEA